MFADRNAEGVREATETSLNYTNNPDHVATAIHVEMTDVESVQKVIDYSLKEYRQIDYFVHSAVFSLVITITEIFINHFRSVPNLLHPCPLCLLKNSTTFSMST